jgi:hypothetical protein
MTEPRHRTTGWFADPRFSLESLSPGQRYTLVIAGALAVCLLAFGLPPKGESPFSSIGAAVAPGSAAAAAPGTTADTSATATPQFIDPLAASPLPASFADSGPVTTYAETPTTGGESTTTTTSTTSTTLPGPVGTLPPLPVPVP